MKTEPLYDDQKLLQQLIAGDERAFELLYRKYSNRIYAKLLKLTQAEDLADELLQDTFVILWTKRHTLNPELPIKAWLYQVAINEVYLFYRKLARDKKLQEHIVAVFAEAYTHIEEGIYQKENWLLLNKAIEQLSPQRRQAFRLCKLEGRSYEETAQIMGVSPSTVSNHLVKAGDSIRHYLFDSGETLAVLIAAAFLKNL